MLALWLVLCLYSVGDKRLVEMVAVEGEEPKPGPSACSIAPWFHIERGDASVLLCCAVWTLTREVPGSSGPSQLRGLDTACNLRCIDIQQVLPSQQHHTNCRSTLTAQPVHSSKAQQPASSG
jgi:hypothetical protein